MFSNDINNFISNFCATFPLRIAGKRFSTIVFFQSWAFATFFPFRYSLIRYFNVAIRYRYSATFQKFAIRYSLYAIRYFL
jgi:tetrahydromethanopterin S-methyltransferase subunit E